MNINKNNLLLTGVAASDKKDSEILKCLHFTKDYTEASDGHIAARMSYPKQIDADLIPTEISTLPVSDLRSDFVLPAAGLKDLKFPKKSSTELYDSAFIDVSQANSNGHVPMTVYKDNMLNTMSFQKNPIPFPQVEKCFPDGKPLHTITIQPQLLSKLLDIAKELTLHTSKDKAYLHAVTLEFYGSEMPMKLYSQDMVTGQEFMGLIMPIRVTWPDKVNIQD